MKSQKRKRVWEEIMPKKFLVHNGTMDKFRFRQSVKFWVWEENKQNEYFWRKANTKRIFGIKLII